MSVPFRPPALLAAVAVIVVTLTPLTSFADAWSRTDPAADMVLYAAMATKATAAPEAANADVVSSEIRHGDLKVKLRLSMSELKVAADEAVHVVWLVDTNELKHFTVSVYISDGKRAGDWQLRNRSGGASVRCALTHTVDYSANTVGVTVPRSCLSNPRWVRTGAWSTAFRFVQEGDDPDVLVFADDAARSGSVSEGQPTFGPRIYKG